MGAPPCRFTKKIGSGFPGILRTGQMTNQDGEKIIKPCLAGIAQQDWGLFCPQNVDFTVEHGGCLNSLGTSKSSCLSLFTRPGKHTKSYKKW